MGLGAVCFWGSFFFGGGGGERVMVDFWGSEAWSLVLAVGSVGFLAWTGGFNQANVETWWKRG